MRERGRKNERDATYFSVRTRSYIHVDKKKQQNNSVEIFWYDSSYGFLVHISTIKCIKNPTDISKTTHIQSHTAQSVLTKCI